MARRGGATQKVAPLSSSPQRPPGGRRAGRSWRWHRCRWDRPIWELRGRGGCRRRSSRSDRSSAVARAPSASVSLVLRPRRLCRGSGRGRRGSAARRPSGSSGADQGPGASELPACATAMLLTADASARNVTRGRAEPSTRTRRQVADRLEFEAQLAHERIAADRAFEHRQAAPIVLELALSGRPGREARVRVQPDAQLAHP